MEKVNRVSVEQSSEKKELKERSRELYEACEGIEFRFPGVHPYADEKNRNEEATLTPDEKVLLEMVGEPSYEALLQALQDEGMAVVFDGGYYVTPYSSRVGTLAVATLTVSAYMDGSVSELVVVSRQMQELKKNN